jgi:hypothetical protein
MKSGLTRQDIYDAAKKISNWGRWGDDDQIGTLNNVTSADMSARRAWFAKARSFP